MEEQMPIVSFGQSNPLIDGRQSERALMIQRGMMLHLEQTGHCALCEFPLSSGRRADILAMDRKGMFTIIEIKSSVEDYRSDSKWPEYRAFCDRFAFATHTHVPADIFPEQEGLFIADQYGAHPMRDLVEEKMAPAARKALTLRFARLAALRLERVSKFSLSAGLDIGDAARSGDSE